MGVANRHPLVVHMTQNIEPSALEDYLMQKLPQHD